MGEPSKRSTCYFEPECYHARRGKAANTRQSVSEVVNEAVRPTLGEEAEDLNTIEECGAEPALKSARRSGKSDSPQLYR